jgi:hypothetical protein
LRNISSSAAARARQRSEGSTTPTPDDKTGNNNDEQADDDEDMYPHRRGQPYIYGMGYDSIHNPPEQAMMRAALQAQQQRSYAAAVAGSANQQQQQMAQQLAMAGYTALAQNPPVVAPPGFNSHSVPMPGMSEFARQSWNNSAGSVRDMGNAMMGVTPPPADANALAMQHAFNTHNNRMLAQNPMQIQGHFQQMQITDIQNANVGATPAQNRQYTTFGQEVMVPAQSGLAIAHRPASRPSYRDRRPGNIYTGPNNNEIGTRRQRPLQMMPQEQILRNSSAVRAYVDDLHFTITGQPAPDPVTAMGNTGKSIDLTQDRSKDRS